MIVTRHGGNKKVWSTCILCSTRWKHSTAYLLQQGFVTAQRCERIVVSWLGEDMMISTTAHLHNERILEITQRKHAPTMIEEKGVEILRLRGVCILSVLTRWKQHIDVNFNNSSAFMAGVSGRSLFMHEALRDAIVMDETHRRIIVTAMGLHVEVCLSRWKQ